MWTIHIKITGVSNNEADAIVSDIGASLDDFVDAIGAMEYTMETGEQTEVTK